jgi:hypothetical protein
MRQGYEPLRREGPIGRCNSETRVSGPAFQHRTPETPTTTTGGLCPGTQGQACNHASV